MRPAPNAVANLPTNVVTHTTIFAMVRKKLTVRIAGIHIATSVCGLTNKGSFVGTVAHGALGELASAQHSDSISDAYTVEKNTRRRPWI